MQIVVATLRGRRMTFETIDRHSCIFVATLAKLVFCIDRHGTSLLIALDMTAYAFLEAVLAGADTAVHRVVTLVQNKFHVLPAHDIGRLNTLVSIALGNDRQWHARRTHRILSSSDDTTTTDQAGNSNQGD